MGEKAEVADANEAWGQHVEQETTQELLDGKCHQALLVAVRGVSPAEGDLAIFQADQAVIGDRDPVSVAAEITKNLFRTPEGRFAIDHPVLTEERAEEGSESLGLGQELEIPIELELALGEGPTESGDELTPKHATEHFDRKEETMAGGDPALVIG
jgi:hypothetical protein